MSENWFRMNMNIITTAKTPKISGVSSLVSTTVDNNLLIMSSTNTIVERAADASILRLKPSPSNSQLDTRWPNLGIATPFRAAIRS